jgi:hypothetical protein
MGKTAARQFFIRFSEALSSVEVLLSSTENDDKKLAKDFLTGFCASCEKARKWYPHRNFVSDESAARGRELLASAQ